MYTVTELYDKDTLKDSVMRYGVEYVEDGGYKVFKDMLGNITRWLEQQTADSLDYHRVVDGYLIELEENLRVKILCMNNTVIGYSLYEENFAKRYTEHPNKRVLVNYHKVNVVSD